MKWWTAVKEKFREWYGNWQLERHYKKKLKVIRKNDPFNYK